MKNRITVTIADHQYTLVAEEDEAYIRKVADFVDQQVSQVLDKLVSIKTKMPVYVAENPTECVVKGTEKTLADLEKLKTVLINAKKRR